MGTALLAILFELKLASYVYMQCLVEFGGAVFLQLK